MLMEQNQISEERINEVILNLHKTYIKGKVDKEKIYQYAKSRMMNFYYRGFQNLSVVRTGGGEVVDFRPVSSGALALIDKQGANSSERVNDYIINDFRGDVKKFEAILGQKSPNPTARPKWQSTDVPIQMLNDLASYLRAEWEVESSNRNIVQSLALNGTTFLHTPIVIDRNRYGETEEPVLDFVPMKIEGNYMECPGCGERTPSEQRVEGLNCSSCGMPLMPEDWREGETVEVAQQIGNKKYSNGSVGLGIYSCIEVTTPFWIKGIKQSPWLLLQYEDDPSCLVDKFGGELEKDLLNGMNNDGDDTTGNQGQKVREQMSSPTGTMLAQRGDRWTVEQSFIRPTMYHWVKKLADGDNDGQAIYKYLVEKYPKGLKLTKIGSRIVAKENVFLDDEWTAIKPGTSPYLYADPHFDDYIQITDLINDAWNQEVELRGRSAGVTFFDPDRLNPEMANKRFLPGSMIPMQPGTSGNMSDAFFKSSITDPDPNSFTYITTLREIAREIVGLMPAVFGGEEATPTAEHARRRLNQALMVLATVWNEMRGGWAEAYNNGVKQLAQYSNGFIYVSNSSEPREVPDIKQVLKGGWFFECDQAIPMNWTQLKDFIMGLFQNGPEFAQAIGANQPKNLSKIAEGIGLPGWEIPGVKERQSILKLIDRLLKEQPTELQDQSGNLQYQPSIPVDEFIYDPNLVVQITKEWLLDPMAQELEGTPGYLNILANGKAYQQIIQQQQMQQNPQMMGNGGGGGNPPPPPDPQSIPGEAPNAPIDLPPITNIDQITES